MKKYIFLICLMIASASLESCSGGLHKTDYCKKLITTIIHQVHSTLEYGASNDVAWKAQTIASIAIQIAQDDPEKICCSSEPLFHEPTSPSKAREKILQAYKILTEQYYCDTSPHTQYYKLLRAAYNYKAAVPKPVAESFE